MPSLFRTFLSHCVKVSILHTSPHSWPRYSTTPLGHGTLFLATGFSGSSGDSSSDDVSIDSLLDPEAGCISEVDAYPPNSIQHAVGAFVDGRPFVCGGVRPATGLIDARCHSYDPMLNCWAVHPTEMQVPR